MFSNMIQISADKNPKEFPLENLKVRHHWEHVDMKWDNNIKIYIKILCVCVRACGYGVDTPGSEYNLVVDKVNIFHVHTMKANMGLRVRVP
jgi:hypothetical protein